ncbi:Methylenetetrahydrofolate dehydrogenase (NADP+ dependent) 1 [Fasciola gigantica]|uniref:C-1-tetrahydrofolate synthase, cytoplasmic n=1 Tax=Fasciola gigantica TaxID=46835 RepID=A0A504YJT0_FASGI|nr:Methylenetetrahydrofolate dehydrogenase (NADP+ dependent) 1 [Fasciola gigantica]
MLPGRANRLCGKILSTYICQRIKQEAKILCSEWRVYPKLTVIEVGSRKDSALYAQQKHKFALDCGVELFHIKLPSNCSQDALLELIDRCNHDITVHGLMIQLPLDSDENINVWKPLYAIAPEKDVDGLGFRNTALLSRENVLCHHNNDDAVHYRMHIPCTAAACFALIHTTSFQLRGSHCVVLGRGRLVGAPIADLLSGPGCATVTQCHIHTRNLQEEVARADLLVCGVGYPGLVRGEWIKPGALVLDCGYSIIPDPQSPSKSRCAGDVDFESAVTRAGWITPVPGGVGPLAIAMLFRNTLNSARWTVGLDSVLCDCTMSSWAVQVGCHDQPARCP